MTGHSEPDSTATPQPTAWWHPFITPLLVLYWTALTIGTHLPPNPGAEENNLDKPVHFGAFVGLSVLLGLVLHKHGRSIWIAVPVLLIYAVIDEFSQPSFGRVADLVDWIADAAGTVCGLLALRFALRKRWL